MTATSTALLEHYDYGAHGTPRFGDWFLSLERFTLNYPWPSIEVRLEDLTTPGKVLDAAVRVSKKAWDADLAVPAEFLRAIDALLGLQHNLCPGGSQKTLTPARIRCLVRDGARRHPELVGGREQVR